MLIITRQIEQAKNKKTQSDLNSILNRWKWGNQTPKSSSEFINKMATYINDKMTEEKELKEFLKKKKVKSLSEL